MLTMLLPTRLLLVCCCLVLSSGLFAQTQTTLSNYNIERPKVWIEAPGVQGDVAYTGLGERFTLAAETGYLDSIRIHFDSVSGDIIQIGIFKDIVTTNERGTFHLADYSFFGLIARYELDISAMQDLRDFWVTFPTDHIEVPKEFHVGIGANPLSSGSDEYTSMFRLMGEPHYGQNPTIDSRSDILLTQDFVNFTTDVFDGFFTSGGRPLGMNFHIDAVVEQTVSSVKREVATALNVFPNPALPNGALHVTGAEGIISIQIYDVLGNEVMRQVGSDGEPLTLPSLSAGVYSLIVRSDAGTHSQKLIIQ
jgi:hypothetical protein